MHYGHGSSTARRRFFERGGHASSRLPALRSLVFQLEKFVFGAPYLPLVKAFFSAIMPRAASTNL